MNMNLLMVSDDFFPAMTGAGIHLQIITKELISLGHKVVIITSKRKEEAAIENWNGAIVYRAPSVKIAGFYQALPSKNLIRNIIKEHNINLIHHHYLSFLLKRVFDIGQEFKIPQVYTYHMSPQHICQPWFMKPFAKIIEKTVVNQCNKFDMIMSPSKALTLDIYKSGVNKMIQSISNPIPYKQASFEEKIDSNLKFQILFAGRLAIEKNVQLLIKSVSKMKYLKCNFELRIAGEGPLRQELESLVRQLNLKNEVQFLGHLKPEELMTEYKVCDVFVLPSFLETQGLVAMEAMRFSKPVIVTKEIVSANELVTHGENGFIVDSKNPEDLFHQLLELQNNKALRKQMGISGLKRSMQYSPEKIVSQIEEVYRKVVRVCNSN